MVLLSDSSRRISNRSELVAVMSEGMAPVQANEPRAYPLLPTTKARNVSCFATRPASTANRYPPRIKCGQALARKRSIGREGARRVLVAGRGLVLRDCRFLLRGGRLLLDDGGLLVRNRRFFLHSRGLILRDRWFLFCGRRLLLDDGGLLVRGSRLPFCGRRLFL